MEEDQAQGHQASGMMNVTKSTQRDANGVGQKAEVWTEKQWDQGEQWEVAGSYASRCDARNSEAEAKRVDTNINQLNYYVCKGPGT